MGNIWLFKCHSVNLHFSMTLRKFQFTPLSDRLDSDCHPKGQGYGDAFGSSLKGATRFDRQGIVKVQVDSARTSNTTQERQFRQNWRMNNSKNEMLFLVFLFFARQFMDQRLVPYGTSPHQFPKLAKPGLASDALQCNSSRAGVTRIVVSETQEVQIWTKLSPDW